MAQRGGVVARRASGLARGAGGVGSRRKGRRWDGRGARVTMAGDAVHPMTYQRAQALNRSVTDAGRLVEAMEAIEGAGRRMRGEVLRQFEEEMVRRGR